MNNKFKPNSDTRKHLVEKLSSDLADSTNQAKKINFRINRF